MDEDQEAPGGNHACGHEPVRNCLGVVGKPFVKTLTDAVPFQEFGGTASGQAERDEQDTVAVQGRALVFAASSERLASEDLQVSHNFAHTGWLGPQPIDGAPVAALPLA